MVTERKLSEYRRIWKEAGCCIVSGERSPFLRRVHRALFRALLRWQ